MVLFGLLGPLVGLLGSFVFLLGPVFALPHYLRGNTPPNRSFVAMHSNEMTNMTVPIARQNTTSLRSAFLEHLSSPNSEMANKIYIMSEGPSFMEAPNEPNGPYWYFKSEKEDAGEGFSPLYKLAVEYMESGLKRRLKLNRNGESDPTEPLPLFPDVFKNVEEGFQTDKGKIGKRGVISSIRAFIPIQPTSR